MDDQNNIQSLKTPYAAFIRGDIHSVLGFFSDDPAFSIRCLNRFGLGQASACGERD
jgi:hypothetical protein